MKTKKSLDNAFLTLLVFLVATLVITVVSAEELPIDRTLPSTNDEEFVTRHCTESEVYDLVEKNGKVTETSAVLTTCDKPKS